MQIRGIDVTRTERHEYCQHRNLDDDNGRVHARGFADSNHQKRGEREANDHRGEIETAQRRAFRQAGRCELQGHR